MVVTKNTIDEKLYECKTIANKERADGNIRHYLYAWAVMTIERYIVSGRASTNWLLKFVTADAEALMEAAAKYAGSDDECMKAINRFLRYKPADL